VSIRLTIIVILSWLSIAAAQEESDPALYEEQLETLALEQEEAAIDDTHWQYLEHRRRHRLNLNKADAEDLRALELLTDLQVHQFLQYRQLFGPLLHLYELQAVPGMDIATIRRILPFVTVNNTTAAFEPLRKRFTGGDEKLLVRASQVLERAKGFRGPDSTRAYPGSPLHLLVRYRYQYRDLLQYGFTADKDPGEELLRGRQRYGFDFYSIHLFVRKLGIIKALALGDYSISLGQGLIHWQGQGFKKSAAVLNVKRQSSILKPYTAAGEYNFLRGTAITVQCNRVQSTAFISFRKLSASVKSDVAGDYITSVATSGYHRTASEWSARNSVHWMSAGGNVQYNRGRLHAGVNMICHAFTVPFRALPEPYDYFSLQGKRWSNFSVDYSYTADNVHFFGEMAADKWLHTAILQGMIISAAPAVDMALVYRNIAPGYQSVAGNAFTESSRPENEKGMYTGISVRPARWLQVNAYTDFFSFPWLRFKVHAPSTGCEYLFQIIYTPNRNTEMYCRYRYEQKGINRREEDRGPLMVEPATKRNWRMQMSWKPTPDLQLRKRVEWLGYNLGAQHHAGFLAYADVRYARPFRPWQASCRLQYFATDNYDARIYTLENSVLYSAAAPAFFNTGFRWYINFSYKCSGVFSSFSNRKASALLGISAGQLVYTNAGGISSGQDELPGPVRTTVQLQVICSW